MRLSKRHSAALLAFPLWGGWAVFVNLQAGWAQALLAGMVQGSASALLTLIMSAAVIWLAHKLPHPLMKVLLPPLATVTLTGLLLYTLHTVSGTANPWRTMWLPMTVTFFYCLSLTIPVARRITKSPLSIP